MAQKVADSNPGLGQLATGNSAVMVPFSNQRIIRQQKERDGLRLPYVVYKIQHIDSTLFHRCLPTERTASTIIVTALKLRWFEHRWLAVYHGCFELVLESLGKNPMAADSGKFRVIFFFILNMVYCVYSLESPHQ